jgi:hypothetical protein
MKLNETRLNKDTASATSVELFPGRGVGGGEATSVPAAGKWLPILSLVSFSLHN